MQHAVYESVKKQHAIQLLSDVLVHVSPQHAVSQKATNNTTFIRCPRACFYVKCSQLKTTNNTKVLWIMFVCQSKSNKYNDGIVHVAMQNVVDQKQRQKGGKKHWKIIWLLKKM